MHCSDVFSACQVHKQAAGSRHAGATLRQTCMFGPQQQCLEQQSELTLVFPFPEQTRPQSGLDTQQQAPEAISLCPPVEVIITCSLLGRAQAKAKAVTPASRMTRTLSCHLPRNTALAWHTFRPGHRGQTLTAEKLH